MAADAAAETLTRPSSASSGGEGLDRERFSTESKGKQFRFFPFFFFFIAQLVARHSRNQQREWCQTDFFLNERAQTVHISINKGVTVGDQEGLLNERTKNISQIVVQGRERLLETFNELCEVLGSHHSPNAGLLDFTHEN